MALMARRALTGRAAFLFALRLKTPFAAMLPTTRSVRQTGSYQLSER
jgi:hypothetical protein